LAMRTQRIQKKREPKQWERQPSCWSANDLRGKKRRISSPRTEETETEKKKFDGETRGSRERLRQKRRREKGKGRKDTDDAGSRAMKETR